MDELAPRDHVALAIEAELARSGERAVGLDLRGIDLGRFPNIAAALAEVGIDPAREPVPVAPAAHYTMGGVATDLDGRATLPGLYAVGESACSGLHGANRLASNSLAECFVYGRRAALAASAEPEPPALPGRAPGAGSAGAAAASPRAPPCGATRASSATPRACAQLARDPFPLARLIATACLAREESRGAHQRSDHPATDPGLDRTHTLVGGTPALPLSRPGNDRGPRAARDRSSRRCPRWPRAWP